MKKAVIILSVVVVLLVGVLIVEAVTSRKLDTGYSLTFEGTTAICKATAIGESKKDLIQVTMTLKQGDTVLQSWYKEGYFQFDMRQTYAGLEAGKLYTLEISSSINGEQQPLLSTQRLLPSSPSPTTKPTAPTTQPTVPTTQPTESVPTTPNISTGYACIHREDDYLYFPEYDWSDCVPGQLYWMDKKTHTVTLLLAEQIANGQTEGEYIYFVKKAERNKIYRMRIAYPDQYELLYETEYETVGNMTIVPHLENYLQFMADVKRLVIYDLNTGEETVLLEVHYLTVGHITAKGGEDGLLNDWIWFYGQPTEDSIRTFYMYNRITGEFEIDDSL